MGSLPYNNYHFIVSIFRNGRTAFLVWNLFYTSFISNDIDLKMLMWILRELLPETATSNANKQSIK